MKTRITSLTISILALAMLPCAATAAGVAGTAHDLNYTSNRVYFSGSTCDTCAYCHTPHGALTFNEYVGPLWNQQNTETSVENNGVLYSSDTIDMVTQGFNPDTFYGIAGPSNACLSCHDGVQAMDTLANGMSPAGASGHGTDTDESIIDSGGSDVGAGPAGPASATGVVNLSDDHPVAIIYDTGRDTAFNANPMDAGGRSLLHPPDNTVECTSCHNPHEADINGDGLNVGTDRPFLRVANTNSNLCSKCHKK
ncbi:cytochrome c3 family protein [Candidatus Poribacteria bacterium]|nr:cytochrome c3 family protein [Candidatus Poribacteria bacterium]